MDLYAIDVSKWQGAVDWAAVKNAGVTHAMLRAGYGAGTVDPQFKRNVANCELHGIHWGCYWYSYAASPAEARQEARACLDVIKGLRPTMPVAYDIEYEPCILALDNDTRTEMVQAFLGEIEAAGYYGILYASRDFIANRLNWRELAQYDVWCAQYSATCTCPLPYGMWQYSSENALGIPGFGKSLDCNRVYKDYPQIIRNAGLNGWAETSTTPEPEPAPEPADPPVAAQLQTLCILDAGEDIVAKAQALGLPVRPVQGYEIGPASSGDAMTLWGMAQAADKPYYASYTEE